MTDEAEPLADSQFLQRTRAHIQLADRAAYLNVELERMRYALESVLPSLEDYYEIAFENGQPELIEAATLALYTAHAALGGRR